MTTHTPESLIAFEEKVAAAFRDKRIRAPIHLSGGNEQQLIDIFKDIKPTDHVFSTWRSHYHALLHGIPEEWVMAEILAGRSMYLINKERRFFASSIVGGILPIALGVALGIKRRRDDFLAGKLDGLPYKPEHHASEQVHVFIGDMAATTGVFHEFTRYCRGHDLPVNVYVEDNGLSTNANTRDVWGKACGDLRIERYFYKRKYPHVCLEEKVVF